MKTYLSIIMCCKDGILAHYCLCQCHLSVSKQWPAPLVIKADFTSYYICSTIHSSFFHTRLQTSVLRSDFDGQASLLNLLLRNYLHYNLIEQADKLVTKSTFPETASNNEWARFLYYLGKCSNKKINFTITLVVNRTVIIRTDYSMLAIMSSSIMLCSIRSILYVL